MYGLRHSVVAHFLQLPTSDNCHIFRKYFVVHFCDKEAFCKFNRIKCNKDIATVRRAVYKVVVIYNLKQRIRNVIFFVNNFHSGTLKMPQTCKSNFLYTLGHRCVNVWLTCCLNPIFSPNQYIKGYLISPKYMISSSPPCPCGKCGIVRTPVNTFS